MYVSMRLFSIVLGGYIQYQLGKLQDPVGGATEQYGNSDQSYWVKAMPMLMGTS